MFTVTAFLTFLFTVSQPAITFLKLANETLQQGVKYVQSLQQRHHSDAILLSLF